MVIQGNSGGMLQKDINIIPVYYEAMCGDTLVRTYICIATDLNIGDKCYYIMNSKSGWIYQSLKL